MIDSSQILDVARELATDKNGSPRSITPSDIRDALGYNLCKKYAKKEIHGLVIRHILLENGFVQLSRHGTHYMLNTSQEAAHGTN